MRGAQESRPSMEGVNAPKIETAKDPAELLFDAIMADVRARKKAKEDISFKTHPDFQKWLNLRNKNIADTPITPEQKRVYDARKKDESRVARDLQRIAREQDADDKARDSYEAKRAAEAREAQELAGLTIDTFYKPGKDTDKGADEDQAGSLLMGKAHRPLSVSGRLVEGGFKGEAEKSQVAGILEDMEDLKSVYSIQIASLQEMSWLDRLTGKKGSLERQLAETQKAIIIKSEALIKEFEATGEIFEKQDAVVEQLWELTRSLKQAFSVARAAVGLTVLTAILAGCGGEFAKKVSAADSFNFKAPITASADSSGDAHSDDEGVSVSTRSDSRVAGYRVSPQPMSSAVESFQSIDNRELFALTPDEAGKVDNFTDWRRAILNPEYVGKLQADGTIPTTEKGLNTAIGTKLAITVNGVEKIKMEVKKGGSIWQVLDKNKGEIRKVAKENGGFGVLGLQVESPADSKDVKKPVVSKSESGGVKVKSEKVKAGKGLAKSDVGKGASSPEAASNPELDSANQADVANKLEAMGVRHSLGRDYFDLAGYDAALDELKKLTSDPIIKDTLEREIKRLNSYREALQRRLDLEQVAAKKFLAEKGGKHIVGQDYKTIGDYDAAIVELKNVGRELAKEIVPIVDDSKVSDEQFKLAKIQRGLQAEIERLESAKQVLRVRQHQEMIDKEGKVPKAAPAEKLDWSKKPAVTDLVSGTELELRATGAYARNLSQAHENIRAVAEFLISAKTDNEKNKFLAMAEAAKKVYENILISVGSKNSPNKFTVDQAGLGLEISKLQIQDLQDSLPQKDIKSLADSAKYKIDNLRDRSKDRSGNKAIFGADGALETLQMIIENIIATGKITNADKKKLQAVKRTAHTVIHSDNNTTADKEAAKEILDLVDNLNQGVSKKDRDLAGNLDSSAPGARYTLPKAMN